MGASDGSALILTNYHVIKDGTSVAVTVNDASTYNGTVIGEDQRRDLAVVRICCGEFQKIPFADASNIQAGDQVIAMGYALSVQGDATVTTGIVSAIRYQSNSDWWVIQTDASLNPGNSGGPLLSLSGHVLGINTFGIRESTGGVSVEGFGFAISEVTIKAVLPGLIAGNSAIVPTATPRPTATATPTPTLTSFEKATSAFRTGLTYHNRSEYKKAIEYYDEAIRLNPSKATYYYTRGHAYNSLGLKEVAFDSTPRYKKAIEDYDEAIRLDPSNASAYNNRGLSYKYLGQYANAIEDYSEAIRLDPSNHTAYGNRYVAYYNLGQYEKASQDLKKYEELKPE